jgi:hypothetical protein
MLDTVDHSFIASFSVFGQVIQAAAATSLTCSGCQSKSAAAQQASGTSWRWYILIDNVKKSYSENPSKCNSLTFYPFVYLKMVIALSCSK